MRVLCIDYGKKRVGIAISDPMGITAQAVGVFEPKKGEDIARRIIEIAEEKGAEKIVVGMPYNMDGTEGPRAAITRKFMKQLEANTNIPIVGFDERLSTMQAERAMLAADLSRSKRKKKIDQIAAQNILRTYLQAHPTTG